MVHTLSMHNNHTHILRNYQTLRSVHSKFPQTNLWVAIYWLPEVSPEPAHNPPHQWPRKPPSRHPISPVDPHTPEPSPRRCPSCLEGIPLLVRPQRARPPVLVSGADLVPMQLERTKCVLNLVAVCASTSIIIMFNSSAVIREMISHLHCPSSSSPHIRSESESLRLPRQFPIALAFLNSVLQSIDRPL